MTAQSTRARKQTSAPAGYLANFVDAGKGINAGRVAEAYLMSKQQLAETMGLSVATVSKGLRQSGAKAQTRMIEMIEILARVQDWAGSEAQAMAWYRSQPLPALNGRTAEALVKSGQAGAVREYLDVMALGGFA
jgi:uncharacterized protein (DUF2384 family)